MPSIVLSILHVLTHVICEAVVILFILQKKKLMFNAMGYNASNWQRQDLNSCLTGSKAAFNYYLINYLLFPATNLVNILPSHGSHPHPLPAFTSLPPFLPSHVLSALHLPFAHVFLLGCPLAFLDLPIPVAIIPGLQILLVS